MPSRQHLLPQDITTPPPATPPPAGAPHPRPSRPIPSAAHPAAVVFLSIADIEAMDTYEVHAAMTALHRALRDAVAPPALADVRVLPSLTGAIVLVPDAPSRNLHDLLPAWLQPVRAAGLAVRAGVSWGMVEIIPDADGLLSPIGRCTNIAARLAGSPANPGLLYEEAYVKSVQVRRTHFLFPANRQPIQVPGKRDEVFTCFADPATSFPASSTVAADGNPPFEHAVLLAYDLPAFSDGDLRTLAARVRAVVHEVKRLREEQGLPAGAEVSFSPGGDGGVLALTRIPLGRAFGLATELSGLLEAASLTQAAEAQVQARIGIHYGQVTLYESAEGTVHPTGVSLFDADRLAGDAEARRVDAVVVSEALIESAAKGTRSGFEEIGPLTTRQGTTIRRYVRAGAPRRAAAAASPPAVAVAPPAGAPGEGTFTGADREELSKALLSAYPTRPALAQLVRFAFDRNLDAITSGSHNLGTAIFELIDLAAAEGWLSALVEAAHERVPGNPALRTFVSKRRA